MRAYDRVVQEVTSGFDFGVVSLGPAATGMRTLADVTGSTATRCRYLLVAANGVDWEIGVAEYTPGTPDSVSLSVDVSSNGGLHIALPAPESGPRGWFSCVPTSVNAVLTDSADAPTVSDTAVHFLCAGGAAQVLETRGTALGHSAKVYTPGSTAIGADSEADVPGAYMFGDGHIADQRAHWLTWAGRAASSGTDAAIIGNGPDATSFTPAQGAAYTLDVRVVGRRTSPDDAVWAASARVVLLYPSGGTLIIVGTPSWAVDGATAGVSCSAVLSIVSGALQITVSGSASGEQWRWAATMSGAEQWGS